MPEIVRAGIESVRRDRPAQRCARHVPRPVVRRILLRKRSCACCRLRSLLSITIKRHAIASVIAVPELMRQSRNGGGQSFQPIEIIQFCDAAVLPDALSSYNAASTASTAALHIWQVVNMCKRYRR